MSYLFKYVARVMAMPMLLCGSAGGVFGLWLALSGGIGELPQTCNLVGALTMSIVPAVISALVFVYIIEVANYSRWKLVICLFVVVNLLLWRELSYDSRTQERAIGGDFSACETMNLISILLMWLVALSLHSIWKLKVA